MYVYACKLICIPFLPYSNIFLETQSSHLLSLFELVLLENVIVCHVILGQSNKAVKEVTESIDYFNSFSATALVRWLLFE